VITAKDLSIWFSFLKGIPKGDRRAIKRLLQDDMWREFLYDSFELEMFPNAPWLNTETIDEH
jgi:hypothetical protein